MAQLAVFFRALLRAELLLPLHPPYYYRDMLARIHLSKGATDRGTTTRIVLGVIASAVFGAMLPHRPFVTVGAAALISALIVFGLFRGDTAVRLIFILISCAAAAVTALLAYMIDRTPVSLDSFAGLICRFLLWSSALSGSCALDRMLYYRGSSGAEAKRAVFRLLLYTECFVASVLLCAMDRWSTDFPPGLFISTGLFLLGYVAAALGYRRHVKLNAEDQVRAEELQTELSEQKEQFNALSAKLAALRRTKHDLSNHLTIVSALLRDGQRNDARPYVQALSAGLHASREHAAIAPSLARSRTETLEKNGVRVSYPDVQALSPAERARVWPWTERIVEIAGTVLDGAHNASLELQYTLEPLVVHALLSPASKDTVRPLLLRELQKAGGDSTVLFGENSSAGTVQLAVCVAGDMS